MPERPPINLDEFDFGSTLRGLQMGDRVFERFVLKRLLGRGGMAMVWLAADERLGRDVALKFAPEAIRFDDAAIDNLKEETRKGLGISHPNIVKIYDFLLDETHAAISMEFIDGENLGSLRTRQPNKVFEPRQINLWVLQLLDALDYAHNSAKIVHRDLKPANLMINREGDLRVTDFGIASSISESMDRVTLKAVSSGTLAYMSPQQAAGKKPSVSDDIYAFGSTLFELLTGKPPFYGGDIARQLTETPVPTLMERRLEFSITAEPLPAEWERAIHSCLEKEPANRPKSAVEIRRLLGLSSSPLPPPAPQGNATPEAEEQPPEQPSGSWWVPLTVLAVCFGMLFVGAWWVYRQLVPDPKPHQTTELHPKITVVKTEVTPPQKETPPAKFTTIQAAIDDAKVSDTIAIPSGTYDEQLKFKEGIHLKAAEAGKVIVQTNGKSGAALMVENCKSGSVRGFVFQHSGSDVVERVSWPVVLIKSSAILFEDNTVQSGVGDGLWLTGATRPEVRRCLFRQNAQNGIVIQTGSSALVEACEAHKNGASGVEIRLTGTAPSLTGNTCSENGGSGIVVKDGAAASITKDNKLLLNSEAGIAAVDGGTGVVIGSATCEDNLLGITIQKGAKAKISGSTVRNSKEVGIHFDMAASECEVTGNIIEKSKFDGIMIAGAPNSTASVTNNKTRFNGFNGIMAFGAGFKPTIEHNECLNNGQHGIMASDGTSGVIRNNTTRSNNLSAIATDKASADLVVEENTAE